MVGYGQLEHDAFDAIVTGELTHVAIWMEGEVNHPIAEYFVSDPIGCSISCESCFTETGDFSG